MQPADYIIGLVIMLILSIFSYKLHFVEITGLISAFILGVFIWITGGLGIFVSLLTFFISSSIATKYKYRVKKKRGVEQERSGKRNWKNVMSSGIVPALFSFLIYAGFDPILLYTAGLCAIGTKTADTMASEIGVLNKSKPRLITHLRKKVPAGTTGAVSLLGEKVAAASSIGIAFIGSFLIIYFGIGWQPYIMTLESFVYIFFIVSLVSFIGCNIDSVLGCLFQPQNICEVCGIITTADQHCNYVTNRITGIKKISNEVINFGSTAIGACLGIIAFAGLFIWIFAGIFGWLLVSSSSK